MPEKLAKMVLENFPKTMNELASTLEASYGLASGYRYSSKINYDSSVDIFLDYPSADESTRVMRFSKSDFDKIESLVEPKELDAKLLEAVFSTVLLGILVEGNNEEKIPAKFLFRVVEFFSCENPLKADFGILDKIDFQDVKDRNASFFTIIVLSWCTQTLDDFKECFTVFKERIKTLLSSSMIQEDDWKYLQSHTVSEFASRIGVALTYGLTEFAPRISVSLSSGLVPSNSWNFLLEDSKMSKTDMDAFSSFVRFLVFADKTDVYQKDGKQPDWKFFILDKKLEDKVLPLWGYDGAATRAALLADGLSKEKILNEIIPICPCLSAFEASENDILKKIISKHSTLFENEFIYEDAILSVDNMLNTLNSNGMSVYNGKKTEVRKRLEASSVDFLSSIGTCDNPIIAASYYSKIRIASAALEEKPNCASEIIRFLDTNNDFVVFRSGEKWIEDEFLARKLTLFIKMTILEEELAPYSAVLFMNKATCFHFEKISCPIMNCDQWSNAVKIGDDNNLIFEWVYNAVIDT